MITRAGQRRLRARREPRHRRDARAGRRGAECRSHDGARHREGDARARFDEEPALGGVRPADPQPRRLRLPVGPAARRRSPLAVVHGLLGLWWPTNPFTTRVPPARRRSLTSRVRSTGSRAPRCGCGDARSTTVGGWDERYFMYMEDLDLCWRLRRCRLRGRVRARRCRRRTCRARARPGRRTGCSSSTIGPRGDSPAAGSPARVRFCCRSRRYTWARAVPWRWPSTPGVRARVAGSTATSLPVVTNASRAKRKRAAVRSAKRSRHNTWWYSLTAIVVIVGIALIVYARRPRRPRRPVPQDAAPPRRRTRTGTPRSACTTATTGWATRRQRHLELAERTPREPAEPTTRRVRRPAQPQRRRDPHGAAVAEAGKNATVGLYFEFGGWKRVSDRFTFLGTQDAQERRQVR